MIYRWDKADPRFNLGPGVVVLRLSDRLQRWDEAHQGADNPLLGMVMLRREGNDESEDYELCMWSRHGDATDSATVLCDRSPPHEDTGVLPAIDAALSMSRTGPLFERTIAGRSADCHAIDAGPEAFICVDEASSVLLSLEAPHPITGHAQRIVAEAFDEEAHFTIDFPVDAARGELVGLQNLHFPESFEFKVE